MARSKSEVQPSWPIWYESHAPLGSAVRYLASISPRFNWVGIYRLKGKTLELGPYLGNSTSHVKIPVGKGVCGTAIAEDRDLNVPDVSAHSNYLACSQETKSELVVLIRDSKGRVVGQIDIDSHIKDAFGKDEESAVRRVAEELGEVWPV